MIVNPIFCLNTAKTGLSESYDQEISGFIDRNPGRDVKVRARVAWRNPEKDIGRDAESACRVETDRH